MGKWEHYIKINGLAYAGMDKWGFYRISNPPEFLARCPDNTRIKVWEPVDEVDVSNNVEIDHEHPIRMPVEIEISDSVTTDFFDDESKVASLAFLIYKDHHRAYVPAYITKILKAFVKEETNRFHSTYDKKKVKDLTFDIGLSGQLLKIFRRDSGDLIGGVMSITI